MSFIKLNKCTEDIVIVYINVEKIVYLERYNDEHTKVFTTTDCIYVEEHPEDIIKLIFESKVL